MEAAKDNQMMLKNFILPDSQPESHHSRKVSFDQHAADVACVKDMPSASLSDKDMNDPE
jgi:hypothetical protein